MYRGKRRVSWGTMMGQSVWLRVFGSARLIPPKFIIYIKKKTLGFSIVVRKPKNKIK